MMVQIFGNKDFEELKEQDIQDLIDQREEESVILEFKRELGSNSKEIAKDLSCMANSEGGIIIYGLQEDTDGKAESIEYINSSENFEERIECIIATTINPPIPFKIFPMPNESDDTKFSYIVLVPKSNNLHMVIKDNDNSYYKRSGKTVQKMEDSEIKEKIRLINLNKENIVATVSLLKSEFQELTGTNLVSKNRINYFVIPNSIEEKVSIIEELNRIIESITNNFSEGPNFNSYKSTISNSVFRDERMWHKSTIAHKNGIIEFRRSHDYASVFASSAEIEKLIKIITYANEFYKRINYFGGYKIYMEIGNVGKYYFGETFDNPRGLYSYSLGELNEFIEIEPLPTQESSKNNLKILELIKRVGGVVGVHNEEPYEQIKLELGLLPNP